MQRITPHKKSPWIILSMGFFIGLIGACSSNTPPPPKASAGTTSPNGKKLFAIYCKSCHGIKGNLGFSGAANLQQSTLTQAEKEAFIKYGRNNMKPFKHILSMEEIGAVASYVSTLKKIE